MKHRTDLGHEPTQLEIVRAMQESWRRADARRARKLTRLGVTLIVVAIAAVVLAFMFVGAP